MAVNVNATGLARLLREPADVVVRYTDRPTDPIFGQVAHEVHRTMPHVLVVTHNMEKYREQLALLPAASLAAKAVDEVKTLPTTIFYFQSGEHAMYTGTENLSTWLQTVRDTYED
jgi:hypothetical protein